MRFFKIGVEFLFKEVKEFFFIFKSEIEREKEAVERAENE